MSNFKFNTYSKGFEDYIKLKKRGAILGSGLSKPYNGLQQIDNKSFSRDAISLVLTQNGLTIYDKTTSPLDVFNPTLFVLTYTAPDRLSWTDFGDGSSYTVYKNGSTLDGYGFPQTYIQGSFTTGDIYYATVTYDTTTLTSNDVTIP